jgi:hypothetical protein
MRPRTAQRRGLRGHKQAAEPVPQRRHLSELSGRKPLVFRLSSYDRAMRAGSQATPRLVFAAAALLALGLVATPGLAARGGNTPVRGVVIGVSSGELEIQSETGAVTVEITDETRVVRTVRGTVADLRRGQVVELVRNARSGSVTQVHITVPGTKLGDAPPPWAQERGRGQAKRSFVRVGGVSSRTIRVRYANGRIVTYRLVSKPTVIKDVPGRIGDIAIGQTVLVTRSRGGRVANVIVILRG